MLCAHQVKCSTSFSHSICSYLLLFSCLRWRNRRSSCSWTLGGSNKLELGSSFGRGHWQGTHISDATTHTQFQKKDVYVVPLTTVLVVVCLFVDVSPYLPLSVIENWTQNDKNVESTVFISIKLDLYRTDAVSYPLSLIQLRLNLNFIL